MDFETKEVKNNGNHDIENGETKTSEESDTTEYGIEEDGENKNCKGNSLENKGTLLNFRVMWNKTKYDIDNLRTLNTVGDLRRRVEQLTDYYEPEKDIASFLFCFGIPEKMQKVMYKGLVKDDTLTLEAVKIVNNAKVMVVGSTPKDIDSVKTPAAQDLKEERQAGVAASREPLCKQKNHIKVLEKGKPEDVLPGIKNSKESLPAVPLSGMVNKYGGKVRLTFKLESDQLWLGTKDRTEKLPMSSIRSVISEPIEEQEEYHIMGLQLGSTEASRYWIYWVPAQYVDAIKDTILGKWQAF